MTNKEILAALPYSAPFLFVDGISKISKDGVTGHYTFKKDSFFYEGHFKGNPVTPGAILTECCAQIGVVCLGIFLTETTGINTSLQIGLSSNTMEFLKSVLPGERVQVQSELVYFRFQKLKCKVEMFDSSGDLVCKGTISGMLKKGEDGK